ncbi:MAG: hypothetical protein JXR63_06395 [Spirochaetales bacterium]|nr:hypothetical protein [Spirochaetales bacterium]
MKKVLIILLLIISVNSFADEQADNSDTWANSFEGKIIISAMMPNGNPIYTYQNKSYYSLGAFSAINPGPFLEFCQILASCEVNPDIDQFLHLRNTSLAMMILGISTGYGALIFVPIGGIIEGKLRATITESVANFNGGFLYYETRNKQEQTDPILIGTTSLGKFYYVFDNTKFSECFIPANYPLYDKIRTCPEATPHLEEYLKMEKALTSLAIFQTAFISSGIAMIVQGARMNPVDYDSEDYYYGQTGGEAAVWAPGIAFLIFSSFFTIPIATLSSTKRAPLFKAVAEYNGGVIPYHYN